MTHTFSGELRPNLNEPCYDKVALLIGNKNYRQSTLKLNTPENDAQDLAGVLRSAGFKVVSLVNLNRMEMVKVSKAAWLSLRLFLSSLNFLLFLFSLGPAVLCFSLRKECLRSFLFCWSWL